MTEDISLIRRDVIVCLTMEPEKLHIRRCRLTLILLFLCWPVILHVQLKREVAFFLLLIQLAICLRRTEIHWIVYTYMLLVGWPFVTARAYDSMLVGGGGQRKRRPGWSYGLWKESSNTCFRILENSKEGIIKVYVDQVYQLCLSTLTINYVHDSYELFISYSLL